MKIIFDKIYNTLEFKEGDIVADSLVFDFPDATDKVGINLSSNQCLQLIKFLVGYQKRYDL